MQGFFEHVQDNVHGYICHALPAPWHLPEGEEYVFYLTDAGIWLSGPHARQACHGKRSDPKCPVKGTIVEELNRNSRWFDVSDHLPALWAYYCPGAEAPNFAAFCQELSALLAISMGITAARKGLKRATFDTSPFIERLAALTTELNGGKLGSGEAETVLATIKSDIAQQSTSGPVLDKAHVDKVMAEAQERLAQLWRAEMEQHIRRFEADIQVQTQQLVEAARDRIKRHEAASHKRIREQEDLSAWTIIQEEKEARETIHKKIEKVDHLGDRLKPV